MTTKAKVASVQVRSDGKYEVIYADGSNAIVSASEGKAVAKSNKIKVTKATAPASGFPSILPTPAPTATLPSSMASPNPFAIKPTPTATASASTTPSTSVGVVTAGATTPTVTDPNTGQPVSGDLTVPTMVNGKVVPKTIAQLVIESKAAGNLAKIKKTLIDAGLLPKGTKSVTTVQNAWTNILVNSALTSVDPFKYISDLKKGGFGQDVAQAQQNKPYAQATIWKDDKAQAFVIEQYQKLLHRDPTADELTKDASAIIAQQKKPSSETITKYTDKNGTTHAQTTGGFDETQFITNKLKGAEEYKKIQTDLNSAATQQLKGLAADNGIKLSDTQLVDWSTRLANGESPEIFKTAIRGLAKLGQPEPIKVLLDQGVDLATIYQPYKQTMAQILEVNPNTISLDDPTLRSAIRPEGEMSIYDYQRTLRKDPRWQYTDNARTEAADVAAQVLKDFGFQG